MTLEKTSPAKKGIVALFPDLLGFGGIQEAGRLTARALQEIVSRLGCSASFLSLNDPEGRQVFRAGEYEIPFDGFGRAKSLFTFAGLQKIRKGARIIVAGHPNLALPASWMKLLDRDLKTIVLSHGVEVWNPLSSVRQRALFRADLVLAPSRFTATKLTEVQGVPVERVRILAWPFSPEFLFLADAPAGHRLPQVFPQGRVVLTVGRWSASERYKGADDLMGAVARLRGTFPDLHLVVVGQGDDLPRLQKLAAAQSATGFIHFLEDLSREELAACYARADVFALPSTGEGFGFVFLEAMAFAKPVVGTAWGGITDLVEDGINGLLVPPNDSERLAQSLGHLLQDDSLRAKLGQSGAEIVRKKFRFDIFVSEFERILAYCGLRENAFV
jgi:glycosyltransferase involved in cell wall biosynthesis